jgi:N-acyl-D-aspartate/D-glutamate deacylase
VDHDVLIRAGNVLAGGDVLELDVGIGDGGITELGPSLSGQQVRRARKALTCPAKR